MPHTSLHNGRITAFLLAMGTYLVVLVKRDIRLDKTMSVHRWSDSKVPVEEVNLFWLIIEAVCCSEVLVGDINVGIRHHKAYLIVGVWVPSERTVEDATRISTRAVPWRRRWLVVADDVPIAHDGVDAVDDTILFSGHSLSLFLSLSVY